MSDDNIRSFFQDSKGRIWIGTNNGGLNLLKYEKAYPQKCTFVSYTHKTDDETSISDGAILSMVEDKQGYLWIGTENGGLNILNLNDFKEDNCIFYHFKNDPYNNTSLSNNSVYSLYKDNSGSVWVGTFGDGINMYNKLNEKFAQR